MAKRRKSQQSCRACGSLSGVIQLQEHGLADEATDRLYIYHFFLSPGSPRFAWQAGGLGVTLEGPSQIPERPLSDFDVLNFTDVMRVWWIQ